MLDRIGLTTPPCGVPLRVALNFQSSRYPAVSRFSMSRMNRLSWIVSRRIEQDLVVQAVEALRDITFDEPGCAIPRTVDLRPGGVAAATRPEAMGMWRELRLVVSL